MKPAKQRFQLMFKIYGMIHLLPLPGSPRYRGNREQILERAMADAEKLVGGGVDGFIVENYGDSPFHIRPSIETINAMKDIVCFLRDRYPGIEIGVNVLRNAGLDALRIATECHTDFIRVNAYIEPVWAPEGLLLPIAASLQRLRAKVSAKVKIYADINVKHGKPILSYIDVLENAISRGHPDAIIITGKATGKKTDPLKVYLAKKYAGKIQVIIGSGVNPYNIGSYVSIADGVIVGTYFKKESKIHNPIDGDRVRYFVNRTRKIIERIKRFQH